MTPVLPLNSSPSIWENLVENIESTVYLTAFAGATFIVVIKLLSTAIFPAAESFTVYKNMGILTFINGFEVPILFPFSSLAYTINPLPPNFSGEPEISPVVELKLKPPIF